MNEPRLRPGSHGVFAGSGIGSLLAAALLSGGVRHDAHTKDNVFANGSIALDDPFFGAPNPEQNAGASGVMTAEKAMRHSIEYVYGLMDGSVEVICPIAGLSVPTEASFGPRRTTTVNIIQSVEVEVPDGATDADVEQQFRAIFPDYVAEGRISGRKTARHHVSVGDIEAASNDETYAVLPLRAITNSMGTDAYSLDEAVAVAEQVVTHGGHKQMGRPQAVVKVLRVVEPERPVAAKARHITDEDFN